MSVRGGKFWNIYYCPSEKYINGGSEMDNTTSRATIEKAENIKKTSALKPLRYRVHTSLMASTKVFALIACLVMATLMETGECRRRKRLCRMNKAASICRENRRGASGRYVPDAKPCAEIGGVCKIHNTRKGPRCACAVMFGHDF